MTSLGSKAWAIATAAVVASLIPLAADWLSRGVTLPVDGVWDSANFREFGLARLADGAPVRVGGNRAVFEIGGLPRGAQVDIELYVASASRCGLDIVFYVNQATAGAATVGGRGACVSLRGRADERGVLRVRAQAHPVRADVATGQYSLSREVRVRPTSDGALPFARIALYLCFGLLTAAWAWALDRWWVPLPVAAALGLLVALNKVVSLAFMPTVLATGCVALCLFLVARRLGTGSLVAGGCALGFTLRILAALHPAFPSVDSALHSNRLEWEFHAGGLVTNIVGSGVEQRTIIVPYPPLSYAVLDPFMRFAKAETLTRLAPAVVEGTAPLLLFLLARGPGGAAAAGWAALALALMPEGMLVVAKGITANAVGLWASLCALIAMYRRSLVIALGAWTLACLGHPGITFGMSALAVFWALFNWRDAEARPRASRIVLVALGGLLLAWVIYYREAGAVGASSLGTLVKEARTMPACFFAFRWMNAGKMLQDVVLKFGCFVPLAWLALRRQSLAPQLRRLVWAWLAAGACQAALAVLTPVAFRFEYFIAPAIALAVGPVAQRWSETRPRLLAAAYLLSLAIQLALGWALLYGSFDIINVIIPSNRWPILGPRWPHAPGCDPSWPLVWW